jgi:hypothetical protein
MMMVIMMMIVVMAMVILMVIVFVNRRGISMAPAIGEHTPKRRNTNTIAHTNIHLKK